MRTSGSPRVRRGRSRREEVHAITSAGRALAEDVHDRTMRYLVSMAVRTGCVLGAAFTTGWVRWALVAGAVILPYIAVVAANAGRERPAPATSLLDAPAIGPGPAVGPAPTAPRRPGSAPVDLGGGYLR